MRDTLDNQLVAKQQLEAMQLSQMNDAYKTSMGPEDTQDVKKFKNEVKMMKQQKLREELGEQTRYKKEKQEKDEE